MTSLSEVLDLIQNTNPQKIELGLKRVALVAKRMGVLQQNSPIIHVGGTNGKGTSVGLLEQILLCSGFQVASYTSPHLLRYNERFKINGQEVQDDQLIDALLWINQVRQDVPLTYFEFSVLCALWLFSREPLDVILLEVGLGGRLDATNIINAQYALITTISLDHCDMLGPDREAIAREKAGIFRNKQVAIIGEPCPPHSLLTVAREKKCVLSIAGIDFGYQLFSEDWCYTSSQTMLQGLPIPNMPVQNACAVLRLLEAGASDFPVTTAAISQGLLSVNVPGRWQTLVKSGVLHIFDIAHNAESIEYLVKQLQKKVINGRTLAVFGMLKDKDIETAVAIAKPTIDAWYIATPPVSRGLAVSVTQEVLIAQGVSQVWSHGSFVEAYEHALADAKTDDRVVIFGSAYGVADILGVIASLCPDIQEAS